MDRSIAGEEPEVSISEVVLVQHQMGLEAAELHQETMLAMELSMAANMPPTAFPAIAHTKVR
jgi:hypothetical protein